jgi:cyclophilin family peptidyl-prolyl cis-trans isomerase
VGSEKRERQKENRRARLEAEAEQYRKSQRNRRVIYLVIAAAVIGLVVLVVNVFGDDEDEPVATTGTSTTLPGTTAAPGAAPTAPPPGASITGETPCPEADGSSERTTSFENPPPMCLEEGVEYDAVVTTDAGEFTIALDAEAAPETVNNFVVLAQYHYFDGVAFHRVIPGFVVQGGDATGDPPGTGGPGYAIPDELPGSVDDYVEGSVAMANSGPDTGGSQFFVWLGPQPLPEPDYALFGQVTDGLDVVRLIEADGSAEGTPATVHVIQSVEIVERGSGSSTTTSGDGATTTTAAGAATTTTAAG